MYKTFINILMAWILILVSNPAFAEHHWFNGRVNGIKPGEIKINDNSYKISPNVRVVQQIQVNKFIKEEPAKLENVLFGQKVTVKVEFGGVVSEIIIERYR